jgi:hypothetical protein
MARYLAFSAAAVVLIAGVALLLLPVRYEAFALLRVADRPQSVLGTSASSPESYAIFKRTVMQMLHSGPVLRSTLRDPRVAKLPTIEALRSDPVTWLNQHLSADYPDDAEILRIRLSASRSDDLVTILNTLVDKYLVEVVQKERERRLAHEARLEERLSDLNHEFTKQVEALHTMEQVSKVDGTESARVKKRIHEETLLDALKLRGEISRQLLETQRQIMIKRALAEVPSESRTANPPTDPKLALSSDLPMVVLEEQVNYLTEQLAKAEETIQREAKAFERIDSVSGNVTAKQQQLDALRKIMSELQGEVDRARVERLAQERVTKLDDAQLVSVDDQTAFRQSGFALAVVLSLSLVVVGILVGPRKHRRIRVA